MPKTCRAIYAFRIAGTAAICLALVLMLGCNRKSGETKKPSATQPALATATSPAAAPVATRPATTTTASAPATASAPVPAKPASTYDSAPPYTVRLYVEHPQDPQPGWLKIVELTDRDTLATCTGEFPERNRIFIDTENVRKLRLHIGHLPLAAGQRTILHIDEQSMQLTTRNRRYIHFERRDTGEWEVTGSD